ncbi:MAG: aldose epimerase family protein [Flavobacterium sp.]
MDKYQNSQLNGLKNVNSLGFTEVGDEIMSYLLQNKKGMEVSIMNYGATITSIKIPLSAGEMVDVALGFEQLSDYEASFKLPNAPYFGAVVGRFAGRIDKGTFRLNEKEIQLTKNHGNHHLHGGNSGFSQKYWKLKNQNNQDSPSVTLEYISPSGEENYPGMLMAEVTYMLTENNQLIVQFHAFSTEDTILNLTQHSYFNLDGHFGTTDDLELQILSDKRLEVNHENIPNGSFVDLIHTQENFSTPKKIEKPMDYTFPVSEQHKAVAYLYSKKNQLKMSVFTDQPAVHVYLGGNCFGQIKGKEGVNYHSKSGICFETQNYPDAPNHKNFPSSVLKSGERYHHQTIFSFENV